MEMTLEYFLYYNISFFVRMVLIFTVMMFIHNKLDHDGIIWKIIEWPWKFIAVLFFLSDIIYNWNSTITFMDKPASYDETISNRMHRYILVYKDKDNLSLIEKWRYKFAIGLCTVLSWSDPKHCGNI